MTVPDFCPNQSAEKHGPLATPGCIRSCKRHNTRRRRKYTLALVVVLRFHCIVLQPNTLPLDAHRCSLTAHACVDVFLPCGAATKLRHESGKRFVQRVRM